MILICVTSATPPTHTRSDSKLPAGAVTAATATTLQPPAPGHKRGETKSGISLSPVPIDPNWDRGTHECMQMLISPGVECYKLPRRGAPTKTRFYIGLANNKPSPSTTPAAGQPQTFGPYAIRWDTRKKDDKESMFVLDASKDKKGESLVKFYEGQGHGQFKKAKFLTFNSAENRSFTLTSPKRDLDIVCLEEKDYRAFVLVLHKILG